MSNYLLLVFAFISSKILEDNSLSLYLERSDYSLERSDYMVERSDQRMERSGHGTKWSWNEMTVFRSDSTNSLKHSS